MPVKFSHEERFEYLKQFGSHCMAYSTLQPGMEYFDLPGAGYLAYMMHGKTRFVLAEPICAGADRARLARAAMREHGDTCFVQVQQSTARLLHDEFGLFATPMGIETTLDLRDFEIKWPTFDWVGRKVRKGERKLKVSESTELPQITDAQATALSSQWLSHPKRGKRELAFMARPFQLRTPSVRTFYALMGEDLVGVTLFDPVFNHGKVVAYSPNITRTSAGAPDCTGDYSWYSALKKLKHEGCTQLELGLSPLHALEQDNLRVADALTLDLARLVHRWGRRFYNFEGIANHKKHFQGAERTVYFSHHQRCALKAIFGLLRLSHVL